MSRNHSITKPFLLAALLCCAHSIASVQTTGPEKGALYLHGGGSVNIKEFVDLVVDVTGKSQPAIVVITTPQGPRREKGFESGTPFHFVTNLKKKQKIRNVKEVFILKKKEADRPEAYDLIDAADAVYMTGGNQCYLTDAFLDTEFDAALHRVLERGGVIGGASAGAQVQSSFMTRGDYTKRQILGDGKHQAGFGFVRNCAFDVHVEERNRENDLLQLLTLKKGRLADRKIDPAELLGIGIDQGTAVIIKKNTLKVTGQGQAYIFDPTLWNKDVKPFYDRLKSGSRYDLKARKRL